MSVPRIQKLNPSKVTVSKDTFDRAFRCKDFLEGVPDSVLALKGINDIVTLMLLVLRSMNFVLKSGGPTVEEQAAVKQQAMEMLFDELAEQYALEKGDTRGYARRVTLTDELRAVVRKVKDQPIRKLYQNAELFMSPEWCRDINKLLPDCCKDCDGGGEVPVGIIRDTTPIPGIGMATCCKCNGYGHTTLTESKKAEDDPEFNGWGPEFK